MTPAELAEANVGAVYAIAAEKHKHLGGDYDELVADGMEGLMQAAHRFDPDKFDGKFSTYARTRVIGAMIDGYRARYYYGHHGKGGSRRTLPLENADADRLEERYLAARGLPTVQSAEDDVIDRQALGALLEKVAELPPHLRVVAEVMWMDGFTWVGTGGKGDGRIAWLAEQEGVTPSAISRRLMTLRERLAA